MLKIKEEYNLYQILSKQNLLDQEIRSVKAGMHTLIYDNYSKLIAVSEVLSKIKLNYGKIEEDKNLLECKMGFIENLSSNISKNLPSSENKQLELMKSKENKYQQSESLKGIIEESRDIIWYIQGKLRTKLDCCIYSIEEIALTLNLILDLGEEKEQALQDFLLIVKDNLSNILLRIEGDCLEDSGDCKTSTDFKITFCSDSSYRFSKRSLTISLRSYFAYALDRLYRECYECSICIPDSTLSQKSSEVILNICSDRCGYHFGKMKCDFLQYVHCLEEKLSGERPFLDEALSWLNIVVKDVCINTFNSLCNFLKPEYKYSRNAHFRKQFCYVLAREGIFVSFFWYLNDTILKHFSTSKPKEETVLCMCTLLTKYILELHKTTVCSFSTWWTNKCRHQKLTLR
ncbi:vacuolar protein sorting-associated protein 51 homolog [Caerostris extrusa]|uniref:Vacuolar protein sorting-associated protein 51 homolog n=1 Tax=Caerostris extrusa TaxID=172846 RepID=A0AAV4Y4W4_CAEEX|nr:vacuolar protein sorting-associated protein 51 homolog [Caerostris extrusa]